MALEIHADLLTPAQLGSVTYDEAVPDKATHFFYSLTHTVEETGCSDPFVNTATVGSEGVLHDTDTASAVVCPVPGTWRVEKVSDSDGPVAVGLGVSTAEQATEILKDLVSEREARPITPQAILDSTADYFGYTVEELIDSLARRTRATRGRG